MHSNFKEIHIGSVILKITQEKEIEEQRISKFLNKSTDEIEKMYESKDMSTELLLLWSKLLEYDFFRLYTHHLVLYSSTYSAKNRLENKKESKIPRFKKNIYTVEIIEFVLELIKTGEKSISEIIKEYNIPKTTIHRWVQKYQKQNDTKL